METYGTVRQATDDNIIRRMRLACRVRKATNTHPEYVILTAFPRNSGFANSHGCYVINHCLS